MQISKSQLKTQNYLEQKAEKYAEKIVRLPFVRAVFLTGSVATGRVTEKSDIDFLIVTKPGRIFLTRAITVLYVKSLGQYRTNAKRAGKICLNWFIAPQSQISKLKSQNHHRHGGIPKKRDNSKLKINWEKAGRVKILASRNNSIWIEKLLSGEFGNSLERLAKNYQIARFKKDPRTYAKGSEVRWGDNEIGLHPPKKS